MQPKLSEAIFTLGRSIKSFITLASSIMIVSNSDYLRQLEIVRKIRDTIKATDEINLPQICVIGDQSSGKSSFLSRLTGVRFPTAGKMCTKAAVVVTCSRDPSLTKPKYEIEDWMNPGKYNEISSTEKAIQDTQNKLLKKMSGRNGKKWNQDENCIVTDQSIKLRVTSPDVIDIIIVDLPGIQHAGPTVNSILTLIESNIEKPETLNLIVSEAKQDAELTKAIEIAEKYDPDHSRTIRVLSKFDNFDTDETRLRAVKIIQDGLLRGPGRREITGNLNLGPHAIISIGDNGKLRTGKLDDDKERKQLVNEYKVPGDRAGIMTLMDRLQPLFARLIKENLPVLKQNVSANLNKTEHTLEKVGREPLSPNDIVNRCYQVLKEKVEELEKALTKSCFLPMRDEINATKEKVTFEFATSGFETNSFHCVLFQGQRTFEEAVKTIQELWEPILVEFIKKATEVVFESTQCLRTDASTNVYGRLISTIQVERK